MRVPRAFKRPAKTFGGGGGGGGAHTNSELPQAGFPSSGGRMVVYATPLDRRVEARRAELASRSGPQQQHAPSTYHAHA